MFEFIPILLGRNRLSVPLYGKSKIKELLYSLSRCCLFRKLYSFFPPNE